ncbi:MAG: hypothetical protein IKZ58_06445 [Selenomonadaceae bacterium]|nr:hypothetical protein [Selenomonadaceae bacterium]
MARYTLSKNFSEIAETLMITMLKLMRSYTEGWDCKYLLPHQIVNAIMPNFVKVFETEELEQLKRDGDKIFAIAKDGQKIFLEETPNARRYMKNIGMAMRLFKVEKEVTPEKKKLCEEIGSELEMMIKNAGLGSDSKREQRELYLRNDIGR